MPVCAYCGKSETALTREHLYPKSLAQIFVKPEVGSQSHFFSERIPGKYAAGELTVKDVCAKCNNGVLSDLDACQTKWAQKHAKFFSKGESIMMSYEYDMMLRWILKFAFNSARVHNANDVNLLMRFRGYILGRAKRPARMRLSASLIYSFVPTTPEDIAAVGDKPLHPDLMRSSLLLLRNFSSKYELSARRVALGAFAFMVVAFEPSAPASELHALTTLIDRECPGFRVLDPSRTTCKLTASFENAVESLRDHAILQGIPYQNLFNEFQRKRGGV